MKLASYRDGSRDGQLVVVSRDLTLAHYATGIASRLQQVLDDWNFVSPQLQTLARSLEQGKARHAFAFDPAQCLAPLPRAYQVVAACAYPPPGADDASARPESPPLFQASGDSLAGPRDDIACAGGDVDIDFEAQLAVVTGDLPAGVEADEAIDGIRLLALANGTRLRRAEGEAGVPGAGSVRSRPMTAFSPVAVTPDELGTAWHGGRVHLNLESAWNGKRFGLVDAAADMRWHFGELLAALATRGVGAGSIVASGPVAQRDTTRGHGCIANQRAGEAAETGTARTGFLQFGDTLRVEMKGLDGASVFGAIEQTVRPLARGAAA